MKTYDHQKNDTVYFMTLKNDAKVEEKLICALENDTRNLANFHQSS